MTDIAATARVATHTLPRALRGLARRIPFAWRAYELLGSARVAGADLFAIRLFFMVRPYTMATDERLRNVYDLATDIEGRRLSGVFVEFGVWRGGCAAVMAAVARRARSGRRLWLFDSFEGLPEPTAADGDAAAAYASGRASGALRSIQQCVASLDDVREVMAKLRIDAGSVEVRQGWFQDTLPVAIREMGPIALLRLDGDWYESTRLCLEQLYDQVVTGGYVVIDDYDYWEGCRRAVDEFVTARRIQVTLHPIRATGGAPNGRYFAKPEGPRA